MNRNERFLVGIHCMTYNQASYIEDALDGFAMQNTSFPYFALVVDDASLDGEQEIIKSYIEKHFDHSEDTGYKQWETDDASWIYARHNENENCFFVVAFLKRNLYGNPQKWEVLNDWLNISKFIAICEGDDYWTDPLKLQKQVNILEADETLMAVVTNSKLVDKNGNELKAKQDNIVPDNKQGRYDLRSFMNNVHHYPTATVCYRRTHTEEIAGMTTHMANPYLGDWTLWIALHVFGDFYYLDQVTSAYRINPTSVTHTCDRVNRAKANWKICKSVQEILPDTYDDIRKSLDAKDWMWKDLAFAHKHERHFFRMLWCFFMAFLHNPKCLWELFTINKKRKHQLSEMEI